MLQESGRRVTPTAETHYNAEEFEYHLHDICYNSEELAKKGDPDQADFNLRHMLSFQAENGFQPNYVLTPSASKLHVERWTFNNNRRSDYTQPAVVAQAVAATHEAYIVQDRQAEANKFLSDIYDKTKAMYDYRNEYLRFSPECALTILIHPHQSGRDSDPSLNHFKWFPKSLDRNGADTGRFKDLLRVPFDWGGAITLNLKQQRVKWEVEKARQNYCRVDVEDNVRYAHNLRVLAGLAEKVDDIKGGEKYDSLATEVERQARERLWSPDAEWPLPERRKSGDRYTKGLFLAMDGSGNLINEVSVSNLCSIGFKSLTPEQVKANLRLALISFNTHVPFASVPTDSRYYDPNNQMWARLHLGGVWAYQVRLISDGFRMHAERDDLGDYTPYLSELVADISAGSSREVFLPHKPEFVHPETGIPQRYPWVRGFGMSGQPNLMEHRGHISRLQNDESYFRLCAAIGRIVPIIQLEQ